MTEKNEDKLAGEIEQSTKEILGMDLNNIFPHSRTFDYIRYDVYHTALQEKFKSAFLDLEALGGFLENGRAKSLFKTKLEEAYMWTGKAIRDMQISTTESLHEPSRTDV